jgi:hypothetical protein
MKKTDVIKLFLKIAAAYPEMKDKLFPPKSDSAEDAELHLVLWSDMLSDVSFEIANLALLNHIANCKFAPKISEIRERIDKITHADSIITAGEAWQEALKYFKAVAHFQGLFDDNPRKNYSLKNRQKAPFLKRLNTHTRCWVDTKRSEIPKT